MDDSSRPQIEITFQTRGLQWPGQEWDISRLLALEKRYPGLKMEYFTASATGQTRLLFTLRDPRPPVLKTGNKQKDKAALKTWNAQREQFGQAILAAAEHTSCVLSVDSRNDFKPVKWRTRVLPSDWLNSWTIQPEFGYQSDCRWSYNFSWRSACRGCTAVHDREHNCCRRAVEQPASTGLYEAERGGPLSLADACVLEDLRSRIPWPVPGSDTFDDDDFCTWFPAARHLGIRDRNAELKRRVNAAACQVLVIAKILLRPARKSRLPVEILRLIVAETRNPVLTDAQHARLIAHAIDPETTARVAHVLCAAAREPSPDIAVTDTVFGEARRRALRDEWMYNGDMVWLRGYERARKELGAGTSEGQVWPLLEDRQKVLQFLWFCPDWFAAWPYDEDGMRLDVPQKPDSDQYGMPFPDTVAWAIECDWSESMGDGSGPDFVDGDQDAGR